MTMNEYLNEYERLAKLQAKAFKAGKSDEFDRLQAEIDGCRTGEVMWNVFRNICQQAGIHVEYE